MCDVQTEPSRAPLAESIRTELVALEELAHEVGVNSGAAINDFEANIHAPIVPQLRGGCELHLTRHSVLGRVPQQVAEHLHETRRIPHEKLVLESRGVEPDAESLLRARREDLKEPSTQNRNHGKRLEDESELSVLNLGQIKDVIDDAPELLGARVCGVEQLLVQLIEVALVFQHERRAGHNAVERVANLVAEKRNRGRLGLHRSL
mmetsp:Transcript_9534/g.31354  ORF Transcript_9534/g.31354 Transcript_9534/m.31354 type:complete len:206 (-) Transcript_9534:1952-2569(-)